MSNLLFGAAFVLAGCTHPKPPAPPWLANPIWQDGKAEFDLYDGQERREGALTSAQEIYLYVQEPLLRKTLVKADHPDATNSEPVLKLNQIIHVPTGLYVCQQMFSGFWRMSSGSLQKFSLTSNDSCGNTYKLGEAVNASHLRYRAFTYWDGMAEGAQTLALDAQTWFYDELPFRVRLLDFTKPRGSLRVSLYASIINSKADSFRATPASVQYRVEKQIQVDVRRNDLVDHFVLSRDFPYLLIEWQRADGSFIHLNRSLRVAYWQYGKPGDLERALNDPKLRLE